MEPTLNDGDIILISQTIGKIVRGDIVIFWYPDDPSKSFIMRIVGLGGEVIRMDKGGQLFIDNRLISEPYVTPGRNRYPRVIPETYIKPHYYFVMGDNRDSSNDSRSWGLVPEKYIYGKFIERAKQAIKPAEDVTDHRLAQSDKIIELNKSNFTQEVINSNIPVLMCVWAEWAGPSRVMMPIIESLASEYDGKVKLCRINVDENKDTLAKFDIEAIPTLIMFQGGIEQERIIGTQSRERVLQLINKHLKRKP